MNFNTSDYFAYKKNKLENEPQPTKKPISKFNFLLQLFIATFIIMFIVIVIAIMKYSSRVDIEYAQGELSLSNNDAQSNVTGYDVEDKQGKIDKRLLLIQQEENAPSEAKILTKHPGDVDVIDPNIVEKNNIIDKKAKLEQEKNKPNLVIPEKEENNLINAINEIKNHTKKPSEEPVNENKNITIMSKVLVGKFVSFEEAQNMQNEIKTKNPSLSPYVRKIGEVFSVQMGSYQDFDVAKRHAQTLKAQGLDVWIYQQ